MTQEELRQQLKKEEDILTFIWLLPPDSAEKYAFDAYESQLWDFAAPFLFQSDQEKLHLIPNQKERLLAILEALRTSPALLNHAPNIDKSTLDQNVAALRRHRQLQAQANAERILSTRIPTPSKAAEFILKQAALLRPPVGQSLSHIAPVIADETFVSTTGQVIPPLFAFVSIVAQSPEEAILSLAPYTQETAQDLELSGPTAYLLHNQIVAELPPAVPDQSRQNIAGALTTSYLSQPSSTPNQVRRLAQVAQAQEEARIHAPIDIPDTVVQKITSFHPPQDKAEVLIAVFQTLAQLAGQDPQTASRLAQSLAVKTSALAYTVSQHTPSSPTDTKTKVRANRVHVFDSMIKTVLGSLKNPLPKRPQFLREAFSIQFLKKLYSINLDNLYLATQDYFQSHQIDTSKYFDHDTPQTISDIHDYLLQTGQDALANLALDAAVAGPIGNWIMADLNKGLAAKGLLMDTLTPAELANLPLDVQAKILGTVPSGAVSAAAGTTEAAAGTAATATATTTRTIAGITFALTGDTLAITIGGTTINIPGVGWIIAGITALITLANHIPILKDILKFLWDKVIKPTFKFIRDSLESIFGFSALGLLGFISAGALIGGAFFGNVLGGALGGFAAHSGLHILTSGSSLTAASHPIVALGTFASRTLVGLGALVATEILVPMIITVISLPIVIALLLFIINNSALVVPPSDSASLNGGPIIPGPGGSSLGCWPVSGQVTQGPYCTYGNPLLSHCLVKSNAIDIAGNFDRPVYASHDGTAYFYPPSGINGLIPGCNFNNDGYGGFVKLIGNQTTTIYAHLRSSRLKPFASQNITSGTEIGRVGSTGCSSGPHLHYELRTSQDIRTAVPNYNKGVSTSGCHCNEISTASCQ